MVRLPGALAVFGKPAGAEAEPFDRQFPLMEKRGSLSVRLCGGGQPLKQSREDEPPRGGKKRAVSAYCEERNIHVG